ncbi:MAG: F0F1 ATP synthase subunit B [Burkholderiales bacterium]
MNINLTLLAQAVAFGVFVWFTAKFVWPPLLRAIERRQKDVAEGLAAAERGRNELAEAGKRSEAELADAREKAQEIISRAEKRATQIVDDARQAARAEGERLIAGAKAETEQQATNAKEQLREQVAALAVAGAEKILRREIDAQAHAELLTQLKREL